MAAGLHHLGAKRGETVGLLTHLRVEGAISELAVMGLGGVALQMSPGRSPEQLKFMFENSAVKTVILESSRLVSKVRDSLDPAAWAQLRVVFIEPPKSENGLEGLSYTTFEQLRGHGRALIESQGGPRPTFLLDQLSEGRPEDVLSHIYTSGTSGRPKAVPVTAEMYRALFLGVLEAVEGHVGAREVTLSFLPQSHVFGKIELLLGPIIGWRQVYSGLLRGKPVYLGEELPSVKPSIMFSVPKMAEVIYEKFQAAVAEKRQDVIDGLLEELNAQNSGLLKKTRALVRQGFVQLLLRDSLFQMAFKIAEKNLVERKKYSAARFFWAAMKSLADLLVLNKIRRALFGPHINFLISGGAAIRPEVAEFFQKIGVEFLEGYGMTETVGPIVLNRPGEAKIGTVGRPLAGVEVKIASPEDQALGAVAGEIMVRAGSLMKGYVNNPEATQKAFTSSEADRWYLTGDLGRWESSGRLVITGRISSGWKNASGDFVQSQEVAGPLKQLEPELISEVVPMGSPGQTKAAALIAINSDYVQQQGLTVTEISRRVEQAVRGANERRRNRGHILSAVTIVEPFSATYYTALGKFRRKVLLSSPEYRDLILHLESRVQDDRAEVSVLSRL